ncbi:MAG TPA: YXWGXW repeat-containing protein [Methylomirabilota bacterium]|jgi:hypothetical protein|nr:YXWGXW repeat-containing protein [Methylomirabilota bacterium]
MRKLHVLCFSLLALALLASPAPSAAQVAVGVTVRIGPPPIPVYEQPICPAAGYVWTPGYWAYGPDGYYWVPGTWVLAPVGLLWTPGYWGWSGGVFLWRAGYWGPHVGFYGGVNYGFGYTGVGFVGGRWERGVFLYNTAVLRVNTTVIRTTYVDRTVIVNNTNRVAFNGGPGGLTARATAEERIAERDRHVAPTSVQVQHERTASTNRALRASENHGRPGIAATTRPGEFTGRGVTGSGGSRGRNDSDRPPGSRGGASTGRGGSNTGTGSGASTGRGTGGGKSGTAGGKGSGGAGAGSSTGRGGNTGAGSSAGRGSGGKSQGSGGKSQDSGGKSQGSSSSHKGGSGEKERPH